MTQPEPRTEYENRLEARRLELARHDLAYRRIAWGRLSTALLMAAVLWFVFAERVLTPWALLGPPAAFLWLMRIHVRIEARRGRTRGAIAFYQRGLARLGNTWAGTGEPGDRFDDENHLYSRDLDIFGPGSLFELLSTGRTRAGEETLASWLLEPADTAEVAARQEAVRELRERLPLREDLASLGPDLRSSIHLEDLRTWARAAPSFEPFWPRTGAVLLSLLGLAALAYTLLTGNLWPYYAGLALQGGALVLFRKSIRTVLQSVDLPRRELELASGLIERLEIEEFRSKRLASIGARFGTGAGRASVEIRRLVAMVERQESLKSADLPLVILLIWLVGLIVPLSVVLLSDLRTALKVERWRARFGGMVEPWILAVGELEALLALSGYAYEHPADPFPEVVAGGPVLDGDALAHPLLRPETAVPNSLRLDRMRPLIVVSGSNMSGKSTLLRTVGVNTVLALAGAPVRARAFRVSRLEVGATLRIQDSLQAGSSRFYSEITRIRDIMNRTSGSRPVLFLLDELLHGTNSHDRAIGAEGIVRGLIARGAIGLATTHDLALTEIARALGDRAINVHFEDRMEEGRMSFDFRMKPGVIEKSNALDLMRAVGLDV